MMELLQLRYFYESAETESFSRTAEKYMVPTSSVSASVRRLEAELGCRLFDRTSNCITLNENGRLLRKSLRSVFYELDRVTARLGGSHADTRPIRMLVRAMRSRITDCIIEYSNRNPDAVFHTVFDFAETDGDRFDIIIDEKNISYPDRERFEVYDMNIRFKAAADSPLRGRTLNVADLRDQPFISMGEQSNMHRMLLAACRRAGFEPKIAVFANDIRCHDKLISAGIGVGLVREDSDTLADGHCCLLDVADFAERYTVYAYYKKEAVYGNVERFLDFLRTEAAFC